MGPRDGVLPGGGSCVTGGIVGLAGTAEFVSFSSESWRRALMSDDASETVAVKLCEPMPATALQESVISARREAVTSMRDVVVAAALTSSETVPSITSGPCTRMVPFSWSISCVTASA